MTTPKDLVESQLPSYFLEQYPQFTNFVQEYYSFLDSTVIVLTDNKQIEAGDVIYGSLSKAKGIVKVVADDRIYFDYVTQDNTFHKSEMIVNGYTGELYFIDSLYDNIFSYITKIEDNNVYETSFSIFKKFFKDNVSLDQSIFRRLNPKTLTKRILDYYKNKGTENSFFWFFRIFFDEDIELYYPKVDILKLSDSGYYRQSLVEVFYKVDVGKFTATRISTYEIERVVENGSIIERKKLLGVTAISRQIVSQTINGSTRTYLDLTYINGEFQNGDLIVGYDMVTGEERVTGKIKESIVNLRIVDGGIGHEVGDRFSFGGGQAKITKLEEYSITKIDILEPGLAYRPGDRIIFDDAFAGYTHRANAFVDEIDPNPAITEFLNSQNNNLQNNPISNFSNVSLNDPLFSGGPITNTVNIEQILPSSLFSMYEVGGIKSIRFEDSGLNYGFAPPAKVINPLPEVNQLRLFTILFDQNDSNVANLHSITTSQNTNTHVTFSSGLNTDALFVANRLVPTTYLNFTLEDEYAKQFITQRAQNDLENDTTLSFEHSDGTTQTITNIDVIDIKPLNDSAVLKTSLGEGIAAFQITEPGLSAKSDSEVIFGSRKTSASYKEFIQSLNNYKDTNGDIIFPKLKKIYDAQNLLESSHIIHSDFLSHNLTDRFTVSYSYKGDNSNTNFDAIYSDNDVSVYVNNTQLTEGVDYTIQNRGTLYKWEESTITFFTPPVQSDQILIQGTVLKYLYTLKGFENKFLSYQENAKYLLEEDYANSFSYFEQNIENLQEQFSISDRVNLDAKLSLVEGVLHPPYDEFRDNRSMLSSNKYFFDNKYYQWYSYEIITKIPLKKIEPLLLDELHPAGFMHFVRNKFELELSHRVQTFELPEIEIETQGYLTSEVWGHVEQEWENFGDMTMVEVYQKREIETDIFVDRETKAKPENVISVEEMHTVYQAFKHYLDDFLGLERPLSVPKEFMREITNEEQILVTPMANSFFHDVEGYLSNTITPHISTDYTHYEMIMATQSFSKLINVEDRANWIADTIGTRSGPIETQGWKTIKNHRVHVEDLSTYITGANPGGMIIARDPFDPASGNTINAQFDSTNIHLANTNADFSQTLSIWKSFATDLSSIDIRNDSGHFTYDYSAMTAYMPVVTGNASEMTKQGSYLPDAEILTDRGWIQFQDLEYGTKVAEVLADGSIKYTLPQEIYATHFDGNVYTYTDNKTFSITVISDQELALASPKQVMYKKKSSAINLKRSSDAMALVDEDAVRPGKSPIIGSIPLKNNVVVIQKRYSGPLYCVNINNFTAHATIPFDATEVDMDELELHSIIDNAHAIPRILIDENKRQFRTGGEVRIDMSHVHIHELKSNTITFDFHNDDYFRYNAANVANTYPEVAPTEIFFFNSFHVQGPTGPYGLTPLVQDLPKTIPRSLEHIILARPDVSVGLLQQKLYEANPGAYFQFANTPNTYFAELGFESYQFSISEEFLRTHAEPISLLVIEQYKNYFDLDENGRPIQNIRIENVSLNLANVDVSIVNTEQENWQRNSSKLELVLEGDVTRLGTENDPRNRSIALSFEQAIPAVQFKDNKPETDSKINLYNISHYDLPEVISYQALYRFKDHSFDDRVDVNPMANTDIMNDPRNRYSGSVLTLHINPYQRSGKYRKLLYPFGFGSLYATFGNMEASFDMNTIYYEPGDIETFTEEQYLNIVDLGNFKTTLLYDKPNVETDIHFAAQFNIVNPEVHERREWHWDFTYDLYTRQEFITEGQEVQIGASDYVVVDQEREFEMMADATIDMPDEFIFEREMVITEYAYGVRKHLPLFDEYPTRWGSMDQSFDSNYRYPHKGRTFWDETHFNVYVDHSLKENWFDFDYELTANNINITSTLLSGGIDAVHSYQEIANTMTTVLEYDVETKILNRHLFFDYRQQIRNAYRDYTKKYFEPYLLARSKEWLGDTIPSATGLSEPTIYLAPMEKKIPMVEYVETGLEGEENFIDSTIGEEFYMETMGAFHVEDRNQYFQTSDIIKPWVGVRIYDWYKSKFAEYFGDKIPTVKVNVMPEITTAYEYANVPELYAVTTLIQDEANFIESGAALQDHEINFGGWRQIRDRNRLFAIDKEISYTLLNSKILNLFFPQEIVAYYKDALPGVEVMIEPKIQFRQDLSANSVWGIPPPLFAFDQIVYFPNTTFYDSTTDVFKQDHIKIDTSIVNRNTSFALRDVYHHRWGNRFIEEFMRTAIRLRDWGGDTIPSATAVPLPELEYGPQLYLHYGNKTGERYVDQQFEGVNYSHDVSDYYIQDTIVYHPNTTFYDATSEITETPEIESDFFIQDSFSTFGLSGVMNWRWYKVRIKEFMKKFIILRYWAEDTIPSVTVVEQPEIEYYPQLYFHYDKNADDQYIDEGFTGSNYSQDISDNYQIHETLIPDDAIRFDATNEGYSEPKVKSDMNIFNSYDVFALNKKILPFMNYTITAGQMVQQIKTWGGEAIPSVFARSWPEITYKPQLYAHYDNAITKNVDDSPESLIANKDVQKYYTLETTAYLPNGTFLDATSDIEIPESQVLADTNVLDRNQFISVGDRVWGTDIIDHQIKDYLLAELHEYNREHLPSVRVVSLPEITYGVQLYGHYEKAADQHVDDSPIGAIETQDIQDYYRADTILYDERGKFAEAAFSSQLEFNQIYTEKDHPSDRFIIRGNELITNMFRDRIIDFVKFSLVDKTPDITRTVKSKNTRGETVIVCSKDTENPEQMIEPLASPFIKETDTIFHNFGSMIDSGMYAEEAIVEYTKFDDMKVDEMFLNLNNKITEDILNTDITKRDLHKQTKSDMLRAHHTVDASSHYVFSMYNEFDESRKEKDILQTKLKDVVTQLERDANFVDGSAHLERDYVFEFLNEVKNADRMIDLDQVFDVSMINQPIRKQMNTFEITDNIRNHLRGSSIETLTEQMFEIHAYTNDLNSNTYVRTEYTLESNTEAPFSVYIDPEINNINSKTLKEDDFLISKIMSPYMDIDIYRMGEKRIKNRKGRDFRSRYTNTSAKMNNIKTEGFSWNISQLNTFKTNWETSVDNEESMLSAQPLTQLLDDFREAIANVTTIEATTNFYNEFNL